MGTPDGGVWGDGASGHAVGRSADLPLSKQPSVVSQPQPSATQQLRPLLQPRSRPWGGAQSSPRWHHSQRTQTKRPSTGTHEGAPLHEGSTHTRCGALNRNAEDAKGPGEDTSAGNQRLLQQSGRPEEGEALPSEGSWRLKTGPPHRRGQPTLQHCVAGGSGQREFAGTACSNAPDAARGRGLAPTLQWRAGGAPRGPRRRPRASLQTTGHTVGESRG